MPQGSNGDPTIGQGALHGYHHMGKRKEHGTGGASPGEGEDKNGAGEIDGTDSTGQGPHQVLLGSECVSTEEEYTTLVKCFKQLVGISWHAPTAALFATWKQGGL